MAYAAPPAKNEISATPSPSNAVAKGGFGKLHDFLVGLFGSTGKPDTALTTMRLLDPQAAYNVRLVPSLPGGSVLRMTLMGNDGNALSADNPGMIAFRSATISDGNIALRNLTANVVLDVTNGATLGHASGVAAPLYWYLIEKDASTWKLAVCGTFLGFSGRFSTTLMSSSADLATVLYADEALSDKPGRLVGITLDTQATAGTWASLPSEIRQAPFFQYLRGPLPRGHISGCELSNNVADATNDIDISPGTRRDDRDMVDMVLNAAITKRLDANWSAGSGNGGLDTGSVADGTYHVWLIMRPDTGQVDALFSLSATAPTMPANYHFKRRIGAILREGGAIVPFVQDGDLFFRKASVLDVLAVNPGTSAVLRTLSVPAGIKVIPLFTATLLETNAGTAMLYVSDPDVNDEQASHTTTPLFHAISIPGGIGLTASANHVLRTNTSRQIRTRITLVSAVVTVRIATFGWIDRRGRDD